MSIEHAFKRADIDGSGDLTHVEWEAAFGMSRALFACMTLTLMGKVSLEEFRDAWRACPTASVSCGSCWTSLSSPRPVESRSDTKSQKSTFKGKWRTYPWKGAPRAAMG
jgi:hypothetical protein